MRVKYDDHGGWLHFPNGAIVQVRDETIDKLIAARNEYLWEQKHRGKR